MRLDALGLLFSGLAGQVATKLFKSRENKRYRKTFLIHEKNMQIFIVLNGLYSTSKFDVDVLFFYSKESLISCTC